MAFTVEIRTETLQVSKATQLEFPLGMKAD